MQMHTRRNAMAVWANLSYPELTLGSHNEWKGHEETRHLNHFARVLHDEHGKLPKE